MALLRRIQTRLFRCQGCTTACCIISPTRTHTHTHRRMQTHTQWQAAAETQRGQKWGTKRKRRKASRRGKRNDGMSQFVDHSGGVGRIRNAPLLELLAVSLSPYVVPLHPSSGSYIPSSSPSAEEVSGAGGRLSGAGSRSDWVIIRLTSCPPVRPNPQPPTSLVPQTGDRNCPGLEARGRAGESCN